MSTPAWRRLLLSLCAFAFLQLGVCEWMQELHFGSLPGFAVPFFGPAPSAARCASGVAFPMLVRRQLRGTLFCRLPDDGAFAADEILALEQLAYRMATDRDDILAAALRAKLDASSKDNHLLARSWRSLDKLGMTGSTTDARSTTDAGTTTDASS